MNISTSSQHYGLNFDNSYLSLPDVFYKAQDPAIVSNPKVELLNESLAKSLGLNVTLLKSHGAQYLVGNTMFEGSKPIAQAYAGHQFGGFNMLGDGRAILLGEHITPDKVRVDFQLKGAGRTPYSRSGDGRAALAPMLREYIISEAMHALGVPTTRSLAVTSTGEKVYREQGLKGAVLTRIAASHLRVGTFQFAAALQDVTQLKALADYTILRHFPAILDAENTYIALLNAVIVLQANLVAKWMQLGFIHGVMNTDNMSICGETIDYGPCAFMNAYHADTVFSSIDANGRYAFANQPNIAHWNLTRFAEALLPLFHESQEQGIEIAKACLDAFPQLFFSSWLAGMRKKLGLFNEETEDAQLVDDLLMYMQKNKADFTNTFVALSHDNIVEGALFQDAGFLNWYALWQARRTRQTEDTNQQLALMHANNPKIIPRNHLVEEALTAAEESGDMRLVHALLNAVENPYGECNADEKYSQPPSASFDQRYKTFCGT